MVITTWASYWGFNNEQQVLVLVEITVSEKRRLPTVATGMMSVMKEEV